MFISTQILYFCFIFILGKSLKVKSKLGPGKFVDIDAKYAVLISSLILAVLEA